MENRMSDWQPIETAPRDGTPVLVYSPMACVGVDIGLWWGLRNGFDIGWYYEDEPEREEELAQSFTHWQPLPSPPSPTQE
jgi:hypothetical protein